MSRNPFGVEDVPDPDGEDVAAFAASVRLSGSDDDPNASNWSDVHGGDQASVQGSWSSRWSTEGLDWQVGNGDLQFAEDGRVFILFYWADGTNQGLIEAHPEGNNKLVGRYRNLSRPEITRPWVGLIVDATRIDGKHPAGRIDFRRANDSGRHV